MSSASPGHVITGASPKSHTHNTPIDALVAVDRSATPRRATSQKRDRDSPATPSRTRALALLGSITDSVRTGAVRGLRALTDSIERGRDDSSTASGSHPSSPTVEHTAMSTTPKGKRRRTVLTEARTRASHANWRAPQWDYSRAMEDKMFYRVADSGPSAFPLPRAITADDEGLDMRVDVDEPVPRPPSIRSAASAPAAFSTPRSHGSAPNAIREAERGWVTEYVDRREDPFMISDEGGDYMSATDRAEGEDDLTLAQAVAQAASLLTSAALLSPAACGAILDFQLRLRTLDPQGNFTPQCPTGDVAITEIRELRATVEVVRAAQVETTRALRELRVAQEASARRTEAPEPTTQRSNVEQATRVEMEQAVPQAAATPPPPTPEHTAHDTPQTGTASQPLTPPKVVGRHDKRRAVFCPASPFGGRVSSPASADDVRRLNNASYQVRDSVNAALRDQAVARMENPDDVVQVVGVNWTERGNLCAVVCDGFASTQLLAQADTVAAAAGLGTGYTAHRDVPIFKAVLCNVPTKKADGTLFSEVEVLADLRTHSTAFDTLKLADSTESARWILTAGVRTLKPRSTLLLNFATAADADAFVAMHRRLFVFGCMCEPGTFQPRDRDRVCTRCWNPLARHRERDHVCRERCRLCGGEHIEEDHSCTECDVIAKPCAHIKLRCINCKLEHAADDSVCEYRRRVRGVSQSAPPMSQRKMGRAAPAQTKDTRKKRSKKTVRILEPHEPFPEDAPATAAPSRPPSAKPTPPAPAHSRAQPVSASTELGKSSPAALSAQSRVTGRPARGVAEATSSDASRATPATTRQHNEAEVVDLDEAEHAALSNLVGADNLRDGLTTTPKESTPTVTAADDTPRRASSTRIAASEAAGEEKRRRVAHVLVRNFKFLTHPSAVAALKTRTDDYVSTVSWAAEEQTKRNKAGMQGKTEAGLRKVVDEMTALSTDKPDTVNNANHTSTVARTIANA